MTTARARGHMLREAAGHMECDIIDPIGMDPETLRLEREEARKIAVRLHKQADYWFQWANEHKNQGAKKL
jgi:hypothetical protein